MRRTREAAAAAMLAVLALGGCTQIRQDKNCKWGMPALGAALGGTGAGIGVSEGRDSDSGEIAGAAAGGAIFGAAVGWLLGYELCEAAPPPPPPVAAPPPPPPARGTKIANLEGPNFDFNKATLTAEGRRRVAGAARMLKENPATRVSVDGYTDSVGSDAYNQRLSERRAHAVADALVADGVDRNRLDVRGFGKSHPVADNKTAAGRARNRRVEIVVE